MRSRRREEHLPALALPDDVCTVCDAVLSQRSCLADGKRHRGRIREAALAGRPCPFGCKLRSGEPAPFTWVHVQIFCSQKELLSRWRTFAEAIGAAELAWASGIGRVCLWTNTVVEVLVGSSRRYR